MADANPGLGGLGAATALTLEEFRDRPAPGPRGDAIARGPDPVSWRQGGWVQLPPNLGPPPPRPDWRKRRS
jgi:hypothetical protein